MPTAPPATVPDLCDEAFLLLTSEEAETEPPSDATRTGGESAADDDLAPWVPLPSGGLEWRGW